MQNDMKNLLDNINVGTIFLDNHLIIKRFTREAIRVYRLAPSDVGRPLADIKSKLEGEDLLGDAQGVLETLVPVAREVRAIDGTWFLARVQPYRTVDNMIDGVVLTFTDITERILAIAERQARELTEGLVETVREPLVVLDGALRVVCASRSFYRNFHVAAQDTIGRFFYELGTREWDISALRVLLESILQRDQHFDEFAVEQNFPGVGWRKLLLNARRMVGKVGEPPLILLAIEEVDAKPISKKSTGLKRPI
jgi:two-component system CheB/CheR fusion protein